MACGDVAGAPGMFTHDTGDRAQAGVGHERAMALADETDLGATDLFPERALDERLPPQTLSDARGQAELAQIERALELSGGRLGEAAERLGISRTTLWKRRKRLGGET